MPACWVCGADADSREHLVKASDLRRLFGPVSPESPAYFHDSEGRSRRLGSVKSNYVKSDKVLCSHCNDTRTQPFDDDWSALSAELDRRTRFATRENRLKLKRIFPGRSREAALNIHLYFAKLFGCRIAGEELQIPISLFSEAVRTVSPCPGLALIFCRDAKKKVQRHAFISSIQAKVAGGIVETAGWTYSLDNFYVEIMWFRNFHTFVGVKGLWRPERNGTVIKVVARE